MITQLSSKFSHDIFENTIYAQETSEFRDPLMMRDPLAMRLSLPAASEKVSKSRAVLGKATPADYVCTCIHY